MIFTEWDSLTEIIVGDSYQPGDLDWAIEGSARKLFNRILNETKEDLDNLADYLSKMGIKVYRPKVTKYQSGISFPDFSIKIPTAPIVPRDQYIVYGNTIYQTYTSMPDRYLDSINYNHIFVELFNEGYNWISQPPPVLETLSETEKWWTDGYSQYQKLNNQMLWHTATMFKAGDAILTNPKGPGNQLGLKWMKRNLDARIVHNNSSAMNGWGHIDHGFFMTDDDKVFTLGKSWLPNCLSNKECINIENLVVSFPFRNFISDFTETEGKYSKDWLEKWLTEWKGYTQEVCFDTNVLVISPTDIMFSNEQPKLFKLLESMGINCHVCKQRHGFFWEAGIHCLTLDIKRIGTKRKIINVD